MRSYRRKPRQGVIAFLIALSLTVIVAVAALAIDGGRLLAERRQVQGAADAAALAAALELYEATAFSARSDGVGEAYLAALTLARENGYDNEGTSSDVRVYIPPRTGEYAGRSGYVEVEIFSRKVSSFSRTIGRDSNQVRGRAVAVGSIESTQASVLILDSKKSKVLALSKGGTLLETTGDVIVNSTSKKAATIDKTALIRAQNVMFAGTVDRKVARLLKDRVEGELHQLVVPTPDPYRDLPPPPAGVSRKLSDMVTAENGKSVYRLKPGTYSERPKFDKTAVVMMEPGTYTFQKGIQVLRGATLTGTNVTLYGVGKSSFKFDQANVRLSPPNSGPYAGITIFLDRNKKNKLEIKKGDTFNLQGTFYAPNGEVAFKNAIAEVDGYDNDDEEGYEDPDDPDFDVDDASAMETTDLHASIIARKMKVDKKSHVRVNARNIEALKPLWALVE